MELNDDYDYLKSEKQALKQGNTEAEWKAMIKDCGARNCTGHRTVGIVYGGVDYSDELPERLKDAGVEVTNTEDNPVKDD